MSAVENTTLIVLVDRALSPRIPRVTSEVHALVAEEYGPVSERQVRRILAARVQGGRAEMTQLRGRQFFWSATSPLSLTEKVEVAYHRALVLDEGRNEAANAARWAQ